MKTYAADYLPTAIDRSPFSNGFEWDHWSAHWCERCVHNDTCPLIEVALMNLTPAEWLEIDRLSLPNRYACTEFEYNGGTST